MQVIARVSFGNAAMATSANMQEVEQVRSLTSDCDCCSHVLQPRHSYKVKLINPKRKSDVE